MTPRNRTPSGVLTGIYMPPFNTVTNRAAVIFDGQEPRT
jgi:hypothetical protein